MSTTALFGAQRAAAGARRIACYDENAARSAAFTLAARINHFTATFLGTALIALLLWLVIYRTPANFRAYSRILLSSIMVDFWMLMANYTTQSASRHYRQYFADSVSFVCKQNERKIFCWQTNLREDFKLFYCSTWQNIALDLVFSGRTNFNIC